MSAQDKVFPVPSAWEGRAWIDSAAYRREYSRSIHDPQRFWAEQATHLDWFHSPSRRSLYLPERARGWLDSLG